MYFSIYSLFPGIFHGVQFSILVLCIFEEKREDMGIEGNSCLLLAGWTFRHMSFYSIQFCRGEYDWILNPRWFLSRAHGFFVRLCRMESGALASGNCWIKWRIWINKIINWYAYGRGKYSFLWGLSVIGFTKRRRCRWKKTQLFFPQFFRQLEVDKLLLSGMHCTSSECTACMN